jgi:hypothetical protein
MERGELNAEDLLSTDREEHEALTGGLFTLACGIAVA